MATSSTPTKRVLGSPFLKVGGKVRVKLLNGTHYGVLESANRQRGTVLFENGQRQTVTGRQLTAVGVHRVCFSQYLGEPTRGFEDDYADKLPAAKREADFAGPGTKVFQEIGQGSIYTHIVPAIDLSPSWLAQAKGELVYTAK